MSTPATAAIASEVDIPYKDWNRVHLERRVSKPRRGSATAQGHRYTAHELRAIEVLRNFTDVVGGSDSEVEIQGQTTDGQLYRVQVSTLSVVGEGHQALVCERCPLILPGMPCYWGVVDLDLDG